MQVSERFISYVFSEQFMKYRSSGKVRYANISRAIAAQGKNLPSQKQQRLLDKMLTAMGKNKSQI
jgi:hypothetical protein